MKLGISFWAAGVIAVSTLSGTAFAASNQAQVTSIAVTPALSVAAQVKQMRSTEKILNSQLHSLNVQWHNMHPNPTASLTVVQKGNLKKDRATTRNIMKQIRPLRKQLIGYNKQIRMDRATHNTTSLNTLLADHKQIILKLKPLRVQLKQTMGQIHTILPVKVMKQFNQEKRIYFHAVHTQQMALRKAEHSASLREMNKSQHAILMEIHQKIKSWKQANPKPTASASISQKQAFKTSRKQLNLSLVGLRKQLRQMRQSELPTILAVQKNIIAAKTALINSIKQMLMKK